MLTPFCEHARYVIKMSSPCRGGQRELGVSKLTPIHQSLGHSRASLSFRGLPLIVACTKTS